MKTLIEKLTQLDGKGYRDYKRLTGTYRFENFILNIDHVQGDPFADPSRCRLIVKASDAGFPTDLYCSSVRRIALEDFLSRAVDRAIKQHCKGSRGSGRSGEVIICTNGQEVLERNSLLVSEAGIEARIRIALPADGRTILGGEALGIFVDEIPGLVTQSLFYAAHNQQKLKQHIDCVEDQTALRDWLKTEELVAFIGDGTVLPRRSGIDDRPLTTDAVPFEFPLSLSKEPVLPNAGKIRGMGIPEGVTLIVGGGFHGKSTLLHALERGVYNHIPGDGREFVATDPTAIKIRAEDGRSICDVDIRPFIDNLPLGRDTRKFSTENASGSTSQAANIIEALMSESRVLLIDEDTSATNFMIRDKRMQALVSKDKEPITPLVFRIRELHRKQNVSTVVVAGGSSAFFSEADTVIMMDNYLPRDVTDEAKSLAKPRRQNQHNTHQFESGSTRIVDTKSLDPSSGHRAIKIQAFETRSLRFGNEEIDVSRVEQLVDSGQLLAIGYLLNQFRSQFATTSRDLSELLLELTNQLDQSRLDRLAPYLAGDLSVPRAQEVIATINRLRSLRLSSA